jgi:hypothetical protein
MRIHLFEFEDQNWLPNPIRKGITDYLRYVFKTLNFYSPAVPLIREAMNQTGDEEIIELCAGGGGPIESIQKQLSKLSQKNTKIILTDKYPNIHTFEYIKNNSQGNIDYLDYAVDAVNVPPDIKGFRTMFTAFHHFQPETAKSILSDAVKNNAGIGIFDIGDKNIVTFTGNLFINPLATFLFSPFFKPFSWSRIAFTYLIPLIPFCAMWDGVVSVLRLYSTKEALELTGEIKAPHYVWKVGKVRNHLGMRVSYLIGYPATTSEKV